LAWKKDDFLDIPFNKFQRSKFKCQIKIKAQIPNEHLDLGLWISFKLWALKFDFLQSLVFAGKAKSSYSY